MRQAIRLRAQSGQPRSARLNAAAGSLGERAVALKIANVLALPAIVMRNDQQDALGMGFGITEIRALRKVSEGDPRAVAMGLGAAKLRVAARRESAGPHVCNFASRTDRNTTALMRRGAAGGGARTFALCQLGGGCRRSGSISAPASARWNCIPRRNRQRAETHYRNPGRSAWVALAQRQRLLG
jgi:hypothetical protein